MPPKIITWTTEQIKLGDLIEWEHNPVKLSDHDAEQIQISIEKFGLVLPLVANRPKTKTNTKRRLIDGHQRKTILIYAEIATSDTLLDVRIPSRKLTNHECAELAIRLRKNTGEFDFAILGDKDKFNLNDLLDWGFRGFELDIDNEEVDYEEAWEGMPEYEQEEVESVKDLTVRFLTEEDFNSFRDLIEQSISIESHRSIWYPKKDWKQTSTKVHYTDES